MKINPGLLGVFPLVLMLLFGCESQPAAKRIGVLMYSDARQPQVNAFLDELKALGYDAERNLVVTSLNARSDATQLQQLSEQLVRDKSMDLLVTTGGLEADALKVQIDITQSHVPVLALYVNAIIERKFVADRRRPGWNVTGIDNLNAELSGKRVELMKELLPELKRLLILYHPNIEASVLGLRHAREEAAKRSIEIVEQRVMNREEIGAAMMALKPGDVDAMLLVPNAQIDTAFREDVMPHITRLKLPVMAHARALAKDGALASYAPPAADVGRQGARLAQKILSGTPASDMPFEIPSKFAYTINKSTLRQLGLQLNTLAQGQVTEYIE